MTLTPHLIVVILALLFFALAALKVREPAHLAYFYAGVFFFAIVALGVA